MNLIKEIENVINVSFEKQNYIDIEANSRVFNRIGYTIESYNINNDEFNSKVSTLSKTFCYPENPNCCSCPIQMFCRNGRELKKETMDKKIPFIDLFCGAGGLSVGLEQYNFEPIFALDFDLSASKSYLFNRPFLSESSFYNGDIKEFLLHNDLPKAPVIVGGPPCQGFSNANRQRLSDDPRSILYKDFIQCVQKSEANLCVIENVPGMLKVENQVIQDFADIGFMIKPFPFNTKDFGYPQNRNRVFWLGIKTTNIILFNQICNLFESVLYERMYSSDFNLEDAICDLPPLEAKTLKNSTNIENEKWGYTIAEQRIFDSSYSNLLNNGRLESFLFNHRTKYNNDRDIEIYRRLLPGEKSDAKSIQDIMPYKSRNEIFKDKFYKLEPQKPSKTITAHMYYDCHMYIHPYQARGLTPREAARIQGFPDNYYFLGRPNEWYRQVGNAVSPLASRHIGKALERILTEYEDEIL